MYTMLLYRPNNSSTDLCIIPKCTRGKYKFQLTTNPIMYSLVYFFHFVPFTVQIQTGNCLT